MQPQMTAFASKDVNLTCSVESASPFTLYWMKGSERIGGPLFYQMTDTSVWTIPEITMKDRGEYACHVVSDNGNHTAKTFVETRGSVLIELIDGAFRISSVYHGITK